MKKNKLIIGVVILLPILFITGVLLAIYIPRTSIKPENNFLYAQVNDSNYYYGSGISYVEGDVLNTLDVKNGALTISTRALSDYEKKETDRFPEKSNIELYVYDFKRDEAEEISIEDALKLKLDSGRESDDGYVVNAEGQNYGVVGMLGGSPNSDYGVYVSNGSSAKKINIKVNRSDYYRNGFKFIGWIN